MINLWNKLRSTENPRIHAIVTLVMTWITVVPVVLLKCSGINEGIKSVLEGVIMGFVLYFAVKNQVCSWIFYVKQSDKEIVRIAKECPIALIVPWMLKNQKSAIEATTYIGGKIDAPERKFILKLELTEEPLTENEGRVN